MSKPEIAVLVSTFERPQHLRRALASLAAQQGVEGKFEVVVTDDGSTDETPQLVEEFARSVDFAVRFTTHPHQGFQLSRCRNEGVAASTAPYIEFLDGDCILPADHLQQQLLRRKRGAVMGAHRYCLDRASTERITVENIASGEFTRWVSPRERLRLATADWKARWYNLIRHPSKPKLIGASVSIWRSDYERVNGHDENFVGWGCEDDDIRMRLRRAGVRIESIIRWTSTYHLWHPPAPSCPTEWSAGGNVQYLMRNVRLTKCMNGLKKRTSRDLSIRVIGQTCSAADRVLSACRGQIVSGDAAEIEVLLLPGQGRFSGRADCKVAVVLDERSEAPAGVFQADIVLSAQRIAKFPLARQFPLDQLPLALETIVAAGPVPKSAAVLSAA